MKVLKNFNNISEELRKEKIPPFGENDVKVFRMLTGVTNPDPDFDQRKLRPVLYPATQIRTQDRIRDPYANKGKGAFVDIGVVEEFDIANEQPTKFKLFVPGHGIGQFLLSGSKIEDVEMYEYLCLCRWNKKNNTTGDALFEEIVPVSDEVRVKGELEMIERAISELKSLSLIEMQRVGAAMKWDSADEKALSANVQSLAIHSPDKFLQLLEETRKDVKKAA